MRNIALFIAVSAITLSNLSLANPIMVVNDVSVEQYPGTTHVQITRQYSDGGPQATVVTRDGATIAMEFSAFSAPSRDLGSGHSTVNGVVGCDCAVALGQHSYVVAGRTIALDVGEASTATGTARTPSANCDTQCAVDAMVPLPIAGGGGANQTTPSAGGKATLGGSGGVAATATSITASAPSAGGGAALTGYGGVAATGSSSATSEHSPTGTASNGDSSGCNFSPVTRSIMPVAALAVLGLLAMRRRK
ncbi:MAG TPA: hypothetical protein VIV60_09510 [Polyangiaceae bacterium]